jgi:hypothetical protein
MRSRTAFGASGLGSVVFHNNDDVQRPSTVDEQDELLHLGRSEVPLLDRRGCRERSVAFGERAVERWQTASVGAWRVAVVASAMGCASRVAGCVVSGFAGRWVRDDREGSIWVRSVTGASAVEGMTLYMASDKDREGGER